MLYVSQNTLQCKYLLKSYIKVNVSYETLLLKQRALEHLISNLKISQKSCLKRIELSFTLSKISFFLKTFFYSYSLYLHQIMINAIIYMK
jgi:hypothetical protein